MDSINRSEIERVFDALGELLIAEGTEFGIIILGGAALNLLGIVERTTRHVDVLAITSSTLDNGLPILTTPEPLPEPLKRATERVARDFRLPEDWVDTTMGLQLQTGCRPGLKDESIGGGTEDWSWDSLTGMISFSSSFMTQQTVAVRLASTTRTYSLCVPPGKSWRML